MPIIIDGYNLLRSVQGLEEEYESLSNIELCRIIAKYLSIRNDKGEIVFDGFKPAQEIGLANIGDLEIVYANQRGDADSVIEEKIIANTAPARLVVVSSDRRLRKAARARKAVPVKSEAFWQRMGKSFKRAKKSSEPGSKWNGISESETKQWIKIFELDK